MSPKRLQIVLACGIALVVFVVFFRTVEGDFLLWDDPVNVTKNELVKSFDIEAMFTDFQTAARYKPVSWIGWAVIYFFYELDPTGYHFANLCLHALNAVLVFFVLIAIARRAIHPESFAERSTQILITAAFAALFWAVHPLRVEPVAWVTGFPYGLSLAPMLLATWFYLRLKHDRSAFAQPGYWIAVFLYLIAVLTYPIVLGFPAALIALDLFPLKKFSRENGWSFTDGTARMAWLEKLPFIVAAGAIVGLTLYGIKHGSGDWFSEEQMAKFTWPARIMQAFYMEAVYLWKTVFTGELCPVYLDLFEIKGGESHLLAGPIVVGMVTVLVFRFAKEYPAVPALWIAHLGLMVPFLGLTTYPHYPSDRYSIVVGIVFAAGLFGLFVQEKWMEHRRQLIVLGLIPILWFASSSVRYAGKWKNNEVFFAHQTSTLPDGPHRADAFHHLGVALQREGRFPEAIEQFEHAWKACPEDPPENMAYDHGVCLLSIGRHREALEQFLRARQLQGETTAIVGNIGYTLRQLGDHQQAAQMFLQLTLQAPDDHLAWMNLGVSQLQLGDASSALQSLQKAQSLAPNAAAIYVHLAEVYRRLGQEAAAQQAEQQLKKLTSQ